MPKTTASPRDTINVSITPYLKQWIDEKVESGSYSSVSEVVREALRLMQREQKIEEQKLEWLRKAFQEGLDSGPATPLESFDELLAQAKEYYQTKKKTMIKS